MIELAKVSFKGYKGKEAATTEGLAYIIVVL